MIYVHENHNKVAIEIIHKQGFKKKKQRLWLKSIKCFKKCIFNIRVFSQTVFKHSKLVMDYTREYLFDALKNLPKTFTRLWKA